ncbi:MAG: hypothetical protein AVDCRST_MAG41-3763, partial [uncultured Corynebacteriales bacterium]
DRAGAPAGRPVGAGGLRDRRCAAGAAGAAPRPARDPGPPRAAPLGDAVAAAVLVVGRRRGAAGRGLDRPLPGRGGRPADPAHPGAAGARGRRRGGVRTGRRSRVRGDRGRAAERAAVDAAANGGGAGQRRTDLRRGRSGRRGHGHPRRGLAASVAGADRAGAVPPTAPGTGGGPHARRRRVGRPGRGGGDVAGRRHAGRGTARVPARRRADERLAVGRPGPVRGRPWVFEERVV